MCIIPKILYKYKAITDDDRKNGERSFTRNIFTKGELYFSRFFELNDPNEAIFDYSTHVPICLSEDELDNELYQNFLNTREDIENRIRLTVDGRTAALHVMRRIEKYIPNGILCLTKDPKNSLMHSYYASGHKGICIGFDWKKLGLIIRETHQLQLPQKIKYRLRPPIVNVRDANNFNDILFTKSKKYKHEKELRLRYCPGVYKSPKNVLSAINEVIFGCAISSSDRDMVISWASSLKSISYYQTYLKSKSYELCIRAI